MRDSKTSTSRYRTCTQRRTRNDSGKRKNVEHRSSSNKLLSKSSMERITSWKRTMLVGTGARTTTYMLSWKKYRVDTKSHTEWI